MEHFDLIQKYLNNQLDEDALSSFNTKLKTDTEFQKEVNHYKNIFNGFRTLKAEAFENQLKEWAKEGEDDSDMEPVPISSPGIEAKNFPLKRVALAGAAVLMISFFVWMLFPQKNINDFTTEEMEFAELKISKLEQALRGEDGTGTSSNPNKISKATSQQLSAGITSYQSQDYQQCIYNSIDNSLPSTLLQYLSGFCSFKNQDYDDAVAAFNQLFSREILHEELDKNEIGWMAILSQLKLNGDGIDKADKDNLLVMIDNYLEKADPDFLVYIKKAEELKRIVQ